MTFPAAGRFFGLHGPDRGAGPDRPEFDLPGIAEEVSRKLSTAGAFNLSAAFGLAGSPFANLVKKAEDQIRLLRQIRNNTEEGGGLRISINVAQRPLGREFDGSGARIGFIAFCDAGEDEAAVIAAVEAEAPASYLGFSRGEVSATEIGFDDAGDASVWDVEVPYGRAGGTLIPPPTGTVVWSGTTAGGTQHITSGLAPGGTFTDPSVSTFPVDWGLAIGATKDGIAGIDITIPMDAFRATKYIAAASWPALRAVIKAITGQTLYQRCRCLASAAGVEAFSPLDLRRTFAGDMLDAGADVALVRQLMGHSSVATTVGYDRRPETARRAAAGLVGVPYSPSPHWRRGSALPARETNQGPS